MKEEYQKPQLEAIEINDEFCLLRGSDTMPGWGEGEPEEFD